MANEPLLQVKPELSLPEKVSFVICTAGPIAAEKAKLSPNTNGLTLTEITDHLRLQQVISQPDSVLAEHHLSLTPGISAFRKGELITAIAATELMKHQHTPESTKAAAILIGTSYTAQAECRSTMATARLQDNSEGLKADLQLVGEKIGHAAIKQVEAGKLDRLTASTIIELIDQRGLSPAIALDLARSISTGQTPAEIQTAALIPDVKMAIDVAKALRNMQSRSGVTPDDVPYHQFGRIAVRALDQAKRLQSPMERQVFLRGVLEVGKVPDTISSLTDILRIVDQNPEIRGVSFDLYDTLVQWTEDFADRYDRFPSRIMKHIKSAGVTIDENQLRQINGSVFHDRWANFQAHGTEVKLDDTINDLINRLTQTKAIPPADRNQLHALLTREWYDLELENAVAMPGARETLEALKQRGIKVALTSNVSWSETHIRRVLNRFGLLEYFDTISISAEIGKMKKPNMPDFFHYSWDKLNLPYSQILHVGDNANDDVAGARNAGARAAHYNNPLAYNRLEIDKTHGNIRFIRQEDRRLYAEIVVHMQQQSLEMSANEWIYHRIPLEQIPAEERTRVSNLAKEMYKQSRDVFAPFYVNLGDHLLHQVEEGKADVILGLARDGLPQIIVMKLLRTLDPDRYPHVKSTQIHYVHPKKQITERVLNPKSPEDQNLKAKYLRYLDRIDNFKGKRILLTDIGTINTHNLFSRVLRELKGAQSVEGVYIDTPPTPISPDRHSFLRETLNVKDLLLIVDEPLLLLESIYSGPKESVTEFFENGTPIIHKKSLPKDVLTRGLSEQSVLFLNKVALQGLIDAVRVRHRSRVAGNADPSNQTIAHQFITFLENHSGVPNNDLFRSLPWQEKRASWRLPKGNDLIPQN